MLKQKATAVRFASRYWRLAAGALCTLLLAFCSNAGMAEDGRDHDRARRAVEAGEVLSLRTILERVEREYPGQVIDVDLDREMESGAERWVYRIKLLRSSGSLIKLKVDARDGSIIGRKGPGGHEHEREQQRNRRSGSN